MKDLLNNEVAEVKLVYKTTIMPSKRKKVCDAENAYAVFKKCWDKETIAHHEEYKVMFLDTNNTILGLCNLSSGGLTGTVVDTRHLLQYALLINACKIICAHNHPSGRLLPSESDLAVTRMIYNAARLIQMDLLDHIIVSEEGYYSMGDHCKEGFK